MASRTMFAASRGTFWGLTIAAGAGLSVAAPEPDQHPVILALALAWLIAIFASAFTGKPFLRMNPRRFELGRWERDGLVYRWCGLDAFRWLVTETPLAWFDAGEGNLRPSNVGGLLRKLNAAEGVHWVGGAVTLVVAVGYTLADHALAGSYLALLCVPLHLYPVMLQRRNRGRIESLFRHSRNSRRQGQYARSLQPGGERTFLGGKTLDARGRRVTVVDPGIDWLLGRSDRIDAETQNRIMAELGVKAHPARRRILGGIALVVFLIAIAAGGIAIDVFRGGAGARQDLLGSLKITGPGVGAMLIAGALIPIWLARRSRLQRAQTVMLRNGHCPHCGYRIAEIPPDSQTGHTVCPECGCAWVRSK